MYASQILNSEKGSALVVAVLILCLLTILGLASTTTTTIDLRIAANDRDYVKEFYVADSGWRAAAVWLGDLGGPPDRLNSTGDPDVEDLVRNFGDGAADVPNSNFPAGTQDDIMDGINYWYNVEYEKDEVETGSGPGYRRFSYNSRSVANGLQEVEVRLSKVYKVGY